MHACLSAWRLYVWIPASNQTYGSAALDPVIQIQMA